MLRTLLLAASFALLGAPCSADTGKQVRDFIEAFNARDLDKMARFTHPRIEWLSVSGSATTTVTQGQAALRTSMEDYFKSTPSARSEVGKLMAVGDHVAVEETASWTDLDVKKSQSSLSVYQFEGGLIRRVWYYPAKRN